MPVTQPDGAIQTLATGAYTDAKFSGDGAKLYAISGNKVSVIDPATGNILTQYTVGTALGAFDLSADGRVWPLSKLSRAAASESSTAST